MIQSLVQWIQRVDVDLSVYLVWENIAEGSDWQQEVDIFFSSVRRALNSYRKVKPKHKGLFSVVMFGLLTQEV